MITIDNYLDSHYIHRSNWLRAAVLGANDGIISISSLAIGVATASSTRDPILLATMAGLVAGALSMAAGEYVSVSSQTDIEKADIEREKQELAKMPEAELEILAEIYEKRGLKRETALQVAKELTEADALGTHVRDELGINEVSQAKPIQAAFASGGGLYNRRPFTFSCYLVCAGAQDGILPVRLYHSLPYCSWSSIRQNRWFQHRQGSATHRYLGNYRHGFIRLGGLHLRGQCLGLKVQPLSETTSSSLQYPSIQVHLLNYRLHSTFKLLNFISASKIFDKESAFNIYMH